MWIRKALRLSVTAAAAALLLARCGDPAVHCEGECDPSTPPTCSSDLYSGTVMTTCARDSHGCFFPTYTTCDSGSCNDDAGTCAP